MPRFSLALLALTALAVAGCGSSGTSTPAATSSGASAGRAAPAGATGAVVDAAPDAELGRTLLVDAHGHTLYVLTGETATHLLCTSSGCLAAWPPLTVGSAQTPPPAGAGVKGALGTLQRSDGQLQVTVGGLPVYTYSGDGGPGGANGEGIESFGGTWHTISASGGAAASAAGAGAHPGGD